MASENSLRALDRYENLLPSIEGKITEYLKYISLICQALGIAQTFEKDVCTANTLAAARADLRAYMAKLKR